MPEFSLSFEVYCSCGEGLCNQSETGSRSRGPYVEVQPCERCLDNAKDEAREEQSEVDQEEFEEEKRVLEQQIEGLEQKVEELQARVDELELELQEEVVI